MRHIPDGVLRRLDDEPLAVPDRVTEHVARCGRCRARRMRIADDTERAARLFSAPRLVPDTDIAWARLRRELRRGSQEAPDRRRSTPMMRRGVRFPRVSLRTGLAIVSPAAINPELPIVKSIRAAECAVNSWYENQKLAA